MKAVVLSGFGGVEVLSIGDRPDLVPGPGELRVRVRATALNRADLLQRRGFYPPPPGASDVLGLEMAGEIEEVGEGCTDWRVGDRVCALLPGGGYAQQTVIPADMAMRIPKSLSFEQAAAIPEAFLTAWLNLMRLGGLKSGGTVLVHAAGSGVGTAAVQLIREAGAASLVTAGTAEKIDRAMELGASAGWNYHSHDGSFSRWVVEQTETRGVDIILDFIGAPYFTENLRSLAVDGRLIIVGTMGGANVDGVDLGLLLRRRQQVIGTALRSQNLQDKISLTQEFAAFALPRFADERMVPVVDSVFDWTDVAAAHEHMESNRNLGKIVLRVGD